MNMKNLPTIEEIEEKTKIHFHSGGRITVELKENIFFRIFGVDMILPKWLISDGNSLPFFLLPFMSPYDIRWLFAGLVHDYIYRTQFLPKTIADNIFRELLKVSSNNIVAFIFYQGVNWGGYIAWWNNSKNLIKFSEAKYDLKKRSCKEFIK